MVISNAPWREGHVRGQEPPLNAVRPGLLGQEPWAARQPSPWLLRLLLMPFQPHLDLQPTDEAQHVIHLLGVNERRWPLPLHALLHDVSALAFVCMTLGSLPGGSTPAVQNIRKHSGEFQNVYAGHCWVGSSESVLSSFLTSHFMGRGISTEMDEMRQH